MNGLALDGEGPGITPATCGGGEIVGDRRIAWRSVGVTVPNAGPVSFTEAPGERGTELRVEMAWAPPGDALGKSLDHFSGDDPGLIVETDLRRFKATMEAGYVALNGADMKS